MKKIIKISARLRMIYNIIEAGEHSKAIELLNDLVKVEPDDPAIHILFGYVYYENGAFDEAIKCLKRVTEIKPDFEFASVFLCTALFKNGKKKESILEAYRYSAIADPGEEYHQLMSDLSRDDEYFQLVEEMTVDEYGNPINPTTLDIE